MTQVISRPCIVVMAGLPGTGKSTLCRALAAELHGVVLDKDTIRAGLFPAPWIEYSQQQDDFCVEILLQVAAYLLGLPQAPRILFIDGRPFAFRYQLERLMKWASDIGCGIKILHTTCADETARQRLADDTHIAKNRNFDFYIALKARFEDIEYPQLMIDTDQSFETSLTSCLEYLRVD